MQPNRDLADLLDRVADEQVSADQALAELERFDNAVDWDSVLYDDVFHLLMHFKIDSAARTEDPLYAKRQIRAVRKMALRLRASAP